MRVSNSNTAADRDFGGAELGAGGDHGDVGTVPLNVATCIGMRRAYCDDGECCAAAI